MDLSLKEIRQKRRKEYSAHKRKEALELKEKIKSNLKEYVAFVDSVTFSTFK